VYSVDKESRYDAAMSRFTYAIALLALLPPVSGNTAGSAPLAAKGAANHAALASADKPRTIQATGAAAKWLHTRPEIVKAKPSLISSRQNRLPDGDVEFCSGPGHQ
jgi:hypothetical protein